jgi:hypothetical protein
MDNPKLKKILPHFMAIAIMAALAIFFFWPEISEGKVLNQHDITQATAASAEGSKVKAATGKAPLWTGAYFSGMPTYQISMESKGNLVYPISTILMGGRSLTSPFAAVLLAMLSMYLLLCVLRVDWRLSIIGAVAYGISTYNMDILSAGHSTKMIALAYVPSLLAGFVLVFRKQYIIGGAIFALFTALQVAANHYQMTYYTGLILVVLTINELVKAIRGGQIVDFAKSAGVLAAGFLIGIVCNLTTIWTTFEYQSESTRGKTELSAALKQEIQTKQGQAATSNAEGGLSKNYAFGWSYGLGETITLLVQNAYGGGTSQNYTNSDAASLGNFTGLLYKGSQPGVGVAIYYGAGIVFLFILGLVFLDNKWRWGLVASALLILGIAWGDNSLIGNMFYDMLPMFKKFRAHTSILGLGQMVFTIMAILSLQKFLDPSVSSTQKQKALLIASAVSIVLCVVAMMGSATGVNDETNIQRYGDQVAQVMPKIREARASLAQDDATRSIFIILAIAAILFASMRGWLAKSWWAAVGIGLICLGDAWTASRRVIDEDKFQSPSTVTSQLIAEPIDEMLMKDNDPNFRVLDLRNGSYPFQNAKTSKFHKSVGGYHAAKMMHYQEMVEAYLGEFAPQTPILQQKNMPLYGMLNVKYILISSDINGLQPNPLALGHAWFVKNIQIVQNADAEIKAVGTFNPQYEAIVQSKFANQLQGFTPQYDSTNTITMTSYNNDKIEYESSAKSDQFAVFSEIYYPMEKGWNFTIDGQPAQFVKTNYILRGAKIPAGKHKIVMEFKPKSYYMGETYSMIASGGLLILLLGGLFIYFRKNELPEANNLLDPTPTDKRVSERKPEIPTKAQPTIKKKK